MVSAYKNFPSQSDFSDDGTMEKIKNLIGDRTHFFQAPRLTEIQKKNIHLRKAYELYPRDTWIFLIDGDEYIEGDLNELTQLKTANKYYVGA